MPVINLFKKMGGNLSQVPEHVEDETKAARVYTPLELAMPYLGGVLAGGIIGSFLTNESVLDAVVAGNGAAGAAAGIFFGSLATDSQAGPLVGAVLLPSAIGGFVDAVSVGVGIGTFAGFQLMSAQIPVKK